MATHTRQPGVLALPLYTIDDVVSMFPEKARPAVKRLEEYVREHGLFRDVLGKLLMSQADVDDMMVLMRGQPTDADIKSRLAAGRMMVLRPADHEAGFMLAVGDQLGDDAQLWIGWCPKGGAGDMLRALQFGNPTPLAVLAVLPATPAGIMERKATIWRHRIRTDSKEWFYRTPAVQDWLTALRDELYGVPRGEYDEDNMDQGDTTP